MTTYYARVDYSYSGDSYFTIPFSYIKKEHIVVLVNDVKTTNYTYITSSQIEVKDELKAEDVVSIRRTTPIKDKLVNFTNLNILNGETQNLAQEQVFNAVQEMYDKNEQQTKDLQKDIDDYKEEIEDKIQEVKDATDVINTFTESVKTCVEKAEEASNSADIAAIKAEEATLATDEKEDKSNKGIANGYASLGEDAKVPAEQLPDLGWRPSIGQHFWSQYRLDRMDMLRADTFSWQNGVTYEEYYNLLLSEYNNEESIIHKNLLKNSFSITGSDITIKNGIASGFSSTSWIEAKDNFSPESNNWEMFFKFTTGTIGTEQHIVNTSSVTYQAFSIFVSASGVINFNGFANNTTTVLASIVGTTVLTANTDYVVKVSYSSETGYTLELGASKDNLQIEGTSSVVTPITQGQRVTLGADFQAGGAYYTAAWTGKIDLKDSYISINNEIWWQGYNEILYKQTPKGFIITDASQEEVVLRLYETTGVAWYHILDIANTRFKLPRMKYLASVKRSNTAPVLGNGTALGLTNGVGNAGASALAGHYTFAAVTAAYGKPISTTGATGDYLSGMVGVTTDSEKSGLVADLSNAVSTQILDNMYLYFYVGEYTQTAIEQTAGLNAEMFNNKVDKSDLQIAHVVIDTYQNGTSWYRVYSDGWCEQGGEIYQNAAAAIVVSLVRPYKNTSYFVVRVPGFGTGSYTAAAFTRDDVNIWNITTSSFTAQTYNSEGLNRFRWYTAGYLVEGEY